MKWTTDLRMLALLRIIARAAEGIEAQLKFHNDLAFPLAHQRRTNEGRKKAVFSRGKKVDNQD